MSKSHRNPTINFHIANWEREEIEAKIIASGLSKRDYFVRSCIYNRVCVVGKKELIYKLVQELQTMQMVIKEVAEQIENGNLLITKEGLADMQVEFVNMLKAIIWMLDGAKYLWENDSKEKIGENENEK